MQATYKWWITSAITLAAVTTAYAWSNEKTQDKPQDYKTTTIQLGSLVESVTATGVIRPVVGAEIDVGSRISGTVLSLPVNVGDRVVEGQLLAQLDATSLEAAADEQRAEMAIALPRVKLARSLLERRQQLATRNLTSRSDIEIAETELAVAEAQMAASRARFQSAKILLSYTQIRAPISGVVAEVSTREGETIAANFAAPTFVTILDLDQLEVLAYVDETDIGQIKVDQEATFTVDTYPNEEFKARVNAIQPRAEMQGAVVNYVVRLNFTPIEGFILRPEMTAHVRVTIAQREGVLKIPRNTLKRKNGQQMVLVSKQGQWVEQNVLTGWRSERQVEILSGVGVGAVLAINPG